MDSKVKVALVIGAAILLATLLHSYFDPVNRCIRSVNAERQQNGVEPDIGTVTRYCRGVM